MATIYNIKPYYLSGGPEAALEAQLVTDYLLSQGYRRSDILKMPAEQKRALMMKACMYAALRLADIEAKSLFRQKIKLP
jgi:hypothetical protein